MSVKEAINIEKRAIAVEGLMSVTWEFEMFHSYPGTRAIIYLARLRTII
jgi:hypothetical protein